MASAPLENGKGDLAHQSGHLNHMPHEGGVALDSSSLPHPLQHIMQDDPSPGTATLVPPLASYPPPMGPNYLCVPYMASYTVPTHCVPSEKIIANGGPNGTIPECDMEVEEDKKPADKEHKKRSKNWTRPETLRLIKHRSDLAAKFNKTGRKSDLWEQIGSALQQENICRDAQQCRDKWEKLMAGYKEVKDGLKDRDEYPFYEELYPLLSGKLTRRDKDNPLQPENEAHEAGAMHAQSSASRLKEAEKEGPSIRVDGGSDEDEDVAFNERPLHKRKRSPKYVAVTDLQAVQAMLDMVVSQQHKLFKEFLETLDRKEQQREKVRQEREEKWRAEELKQGRILNDTMIVLTQKLVGDRLGAATTSAFPAHLFCNQAAQQQAQASMKRSKNWKRTEVLELIKLRGEMEAKFSKSTRRAALWDELSDMLGSQEIKRDGKQCREKWDKLMSEYKDVLDGKREPGDSSYYEELKAVLGSRPADEEG